MSNEANKYILSLLENLSEDLIDYFHTRGFEILNRAEVEEMASLEYILVSSTAEAIEASKDFAAAKNNIEIVCFGTAEKTKEFLIYDGRLSVHPDILQSELGEVILDNYFKKEKSIHLVDNFETHFQNISSFEVTNHMSTGESFDSTCYDAFKSGFNLLSLRTYLDHSLYFLTYLKQSGAGGVPYTYEYSHTSDLFCLNIHMSVKDFFAEYLFESFSEYNLAKPQKHLLTVLKNSCDYLEISFIEKPGKLVLSALWDKSGQKNLRGVGFHKVETASKQIRNNEVKIQQEYDLAKSFKSEDREARLPGKLLDSNRNLENDSILQKRLEEIVSLIKEAYLADHPGRELSKIEEEDIDKYLPTEISSQLTNADRAIILESLRNYTVKKILSDKAEIAKASFSDDQEFQDEITNLSADIFAEEVSQSVKGSALEEFLDSTLVKGKKEEDQESIVVGGDSGDEEDEKIEIKGGKQVADDFKQTVKGLREEDANSFAQKLSSTLTEKEPFKTISGNNMKSAMTSWVVKSFGGAEELQKSSPAFKGYLREQLPTVLESSLSEFSLNLGKGPGDLTDEEINDFKTNKLPSTLQNFFQDEDKTETFASKVELSGGLDFDKMDVADPELNYFANEFKTNLVQKVKSLGSDLSESELQQVLRQTVKSKIAETHESASLSLAEKENKKIQLIQEMAETLNMTQEEAQAIVESGVSKSNKAVDELVQNKLQAATSDESAIDAQVRLKLKTLEEENKRLKDALSLAKIDKESTTATAEKVEDLRKESQLTAEEVAKLTDEQDDSESIEIRKLELEVERLEAVFSQELQKAEKSLKAKDFVVEKAKEAMKMALAKKDADLDAMKSQVHSLSQKLQGAISNQKTQELKQLMSERDNLIKTNDIYKSKLEMMARQMSKEKTSDNSAQINEENRTLKRIKINLEKQAEESIRRSKKLEERYQTSSSNELKLKIEHKSALNELRATQLQLRRLKDQVEASKLNGQKAETSQTEQMVRELDNLKSNNMSLNESLRAANKKVSDLAEQLKSLASNSTQHKAVSEQQKSELKRMTSELESLKKDKVILQQKIEDMVKENNNNDKEQSQAAKPDVDPVKQRLEQSVKKLNSGMMKAQAEANEQKKEVMKAKKEVVGLKNQITALKKDLDKAKKQAALNSKKAA